MQLSRVKVVNLVTKVCDTNAGDASRVRSLRDLLNLITPYEDEDRTCLPGIAVQRPQLLDVLADSMVHGIRRTTIGIKHQWLQYNIELDTEAILAGAVLSWFTTTQLCCYFTDDCLVCQLNKVVTQNTKVLLALAAHVWYRGVKTPALCGAVSTCGTQSVPAEIACLVLHYISTADSTYAYRHKEVLSALVQALSYDDGVRNIASSACIALAPPASNGPQAVVLASPFTPGNLLDMQVVPLLVGHLRWVTSNRHTMQCHGCAPHQLTSHVMTLLGCIAQWRTIAQHSTGRSRNATIMSEAESAVVTQACLLSQTYVSHGWVPGVSHRVDVVVALCQCLKAMIVGNMGAGARAGERREEDTALERELLRVGPSVPGQMTTVLQVLQDARADHSSPDNGLRGLAACAANFMDGALGLFGQSERLAGERRRAEEAAKPFHTRFKQGAVCHLMAMISAGANIHSWLEGVCDFCWNPECGVVGVQDGIDAAGTSVSLKRCKGCRFVLYCGPQCQKTDWSLHKRCCKAVRQADGL